MFFDVSKSVHEKDTNGQFGNSTKDYALSSGVMAAPSLNRSQNVDNI